MLYRLIWLACILIFEPIESTKVQSFSHLKIDEKKSSRLRTVSHGHQSIRQHNIPLSGLTFFACLSINWISAVILTSGSLSEIHSPKSSCGVGPNCKSYNIRLVVIIVQETLATRQDSIGHLHRGHFPNNQETPQLSIV